MKTLHTCCHISTCSDDDVHTLCHVNTSSELWWWCTNLQFTALTILLTCKTKHLQNSIITSQNRQGHMNTYRFNTLTNTQQHFIHANLQWQQWLCMFIRDLPSMANERKIEYSWKVKFSTTKVFWVFHG